MYYEKHSEFPSLPEDLKLECIKFAEESLNNSVPMNVWFQRTDTVDPNNLAYTVPGTELKGTGGVGFYTVPKDLNERICNFFKDTDCPLAKNEIYFIQVVSGGKFVLPHVDNPTEREPGFLYLLKNGGDNVKTIWYEIKEEYKDLNITYNTGIPYFKLTAREEHHLEEDTWHWMNFTEVHSVENQESLRLALWGIHKAFWE